MVSDGQERLERLLKPAKDLIQNWSIDVAAELENYLSSLEDGSRREDDNPEGVNFARAALLLQGTTSVYSRKVEYLRALAYEALDQMTGGKATKKKQKMGPNRHKGDESYSTFGFVAVTWDRVVKPIQRLEPFAACASLPPTTRVPISLLPRDDAHKLSSEPRLRCLYLHGHSGCLLVSQTDATNVQFSQMNEISIDLASASSAPGSIRPPSTCMSLPGGDGRETAGPLAPVEEEEDSQTPPRPRSAASDTQSVKSSLKDPWLPLDEHTRIGRDKPLKIGKCWRTPGAKYQVPLSEMTQVQIDLLTVEGMKEALERGDLLESGDEDFVTLSNKFWQPAALANALKTWGGEVNENDLPENLKEFYADQKSELDIKSNRLSRYYFQQSRSIPMFGDTRVSKLYCEKFCFGTEFFAFEPLLVAIMKLRKMNKVRHNKIIQDNGEVVVPLATPCKFRHGDEVPGWANDVEGGLTMDVGLIDDFQELVPVEETVVESTESSPESKLDNSRTEVEEALVKAQASYQAAFDEHVCGDDESMLELDDDLTVQQRLVREMHERLAVWGGQVEHILEKVEKQTPFDVTVYQRDLIYRVRDASNTSFRQLVRGQSREEICRLFLTTLLMCNKQVLAISRESGRDPPKNLAVKDRDSQPMAPFDDFKVILLDNDLKLLEDDEQEPVLSLIPPPSRPAGGRRRRGISDRKEQQTKKLKTAKPTNGDSPAGSDSGDCVI